MFTRLGLPMNHYTISFFHAFARSADSNSSKYCTSDPVILGPRLYSRIDTARHLVRSDFLCVQRSTQNFEIRRRVSRVKKKKTDENSKRTHTSLSLSLSTCRSADAMFTLTRLHQSLSLSLSSHLQTQFGSRSDPKGIQDRMFRQFKKVCMR